MIARVSRRWRLLAWHAVQVAALAAMVTTLVGAIAAESWPPWLPRPALVALWMRPPRPSPDLCVAWAISSWRQSDDQFTLVQADDLVRIAGLDLSLPGRADVVVCTTREGRVAWTGPARSTRDACADEAFSVLMRTWRYKPLGYPVCAEVAVR